jgi:3-oxoacyl-[acyl-carrier protein] reductase
MDLGLKGRVAMVAGASRGLGFAVAQCLAEEGAHVSLASRNVAAVSSAAERISKATGAKTLGVAADVRSAEAIQQWHRQTVQQLGPVDLLVTNSGGPPPGTAGSFDDAGWQNAFELLLLSVIRAVRAVLPSMLDRRRGSILLLTSSSVKEPVANLALSNVIRPAVAALAKTLALEVAGQGVRVNHLIPGRIATDRLRELDEIESRRAAITVEEQRRRVVSTIPLGRYGEPEEFARAATFLLSDSASYLTGATLQVDGGLIRFVL